jgi:outer membrane receptor protein involved in Fe transport
LGSSSFVTAALYVGEVTVDRGFVVINDPGSEELFLNDIRGSRFLGLRTGWEHDLSKRHYFRWGFDLRHYETDYDYELNAVIEDPINDPRFYPGTRVFSFHDTYEGEQYSLYATDRIRVSDRFTAEIGLRFDRQTLIDDDQLNPRVNLLYRVGKTGALRLGWGHFAQSQRPYELMVQFGQTEFLPYQQAEQLVLGYETGLGKKLRARIDAYARKVNDPHPRWETIFGPWHPIPEVATDLAEIAPESVEAYGLELSLASRLGGRFDWWASYVYSSIEDVIAGKGTPRYLNQPHAFTVSGSWRPGPKWALTGVLHYHTGWPGTEASANVVSAPGGGLRLDYDIGPFYEGFWEDYLRLDLRASWTSRVGRKGELSFFIDVQNLTDRENQRGIGIADPDYEYDPEVGYSVSFSRENWLPIIPSFGVSYEF